MATLSPAIVETIHSYYLQQGDRSCDLAVEEHSVKKVLEAVNEVVNKGSINFDATYFEPPAEDLRSRASWIVKELGARGIAVTLEIFNDDPPEDHLPPPNCRIIRKVALPSHE